MEPGRLAPPIKRVELFANQLLEEVKVLCNESQGEAWIEASALMKLAEVLATKTNQLVQKRLR